MKPYSNAESGSTDWLAERRRQSCKRGNTSEPDSRAAAVLLRCGRFQTRMSFLPRGPVGPRHGRQLQSEKQPKNAHWRGWVMDCNSASTVLGSIPARQASASLRMRPECAILEDAFTITRPEHRSCAKRTAESSKLQQREPKALKRRKSGPESCKSAAHSRIILPASSAKLHDDGHGSGWACGLGRVHLWYA
jgi:hypothetical protein